MATGETFKCSVIGRLTDLTAVVFDFGYVDNASGSVHLDTGILAGNFQTLVQATLAAALPADYRFIRYRAACVGGTHNGEIGYVDVSPPVDGILDPAFRMPNEIAISMKRSTGHASRRDRGRVFFGPIVAAWVEPSNVNQAVDAAGLHAVADLLKANLVSGGVTLKPVILSAAGTYSGNLINQSSYAIDFVHHKSRRPRVGA